MTRIRPQGWDRGAVTIMIVGFVFAIFIAIGLVVDGGNKMRTIERADTLAGEAARAGGQAINLAQAPTGTADFVTQQRARAAARAYLRDAHVTGTVTVDPAGRELTVVVTIDYQPIILGMIGKGREPETGTATAVLLTG